VLRAEIGLEATLEDVFRKYAGVELADTERKGMRDVRRTRTTAQKLG
jgi:ABC-2 type transport system ATP-binding protein